MRYKTLFRVLLKVLGVYLVVASFGSLFYFITEIVIQTNASNTVRSTLWRFAFQGLFSVTIGLYLFFGGKWITDLAIPSNRPYCADCGYDIGRSPGDICQECGALISHEKPEDNIELS